MEIPQATGESRVRYPLTKTVSINSKKSQCLLCLCGALWLTQATTSKASDLDVPLMHGAIFNIGGELGWDRTHAPEILEANFEKMTEIREHGFHMAMPWFKVPGHSLATPIFEWADANKMPLMLMLHQGWEPRMAFDRYAEDPALWLENNVKRARRWAERIEGHSSVRGVILGNETIPHVGTPLFLSRWPNPTATNLTATERHLGAEEEDGGKASEGRTTFIPATKDPSAFWNNIIRPELAKQYANDIAALNRHWGTRFGSFAEVDLPAADSGGWHDLRHIARKHFAIIMDTLIREGFKPSLGKGISYSSKHSRPDPFTWRACKEINTVGWDDVEAHFPLWVLKAAADTTPLPLFNSELHLYHDTFNYRGSAALSRYRYLTSALLGEYWTASFKYDNWKSNPEVLENHAQTTAALRDLEKTAPYLRALARAYQNADLSVLLTEENWFVSTEPKGMYGTDDAAGFDAAKLDYNDLRDLLRRKMVVNFMDDNPFAEVYARLAMLGRPWRYFLENDLSDFNGSTLVVWSPLLKLETAHALAALPAGVRLLFVDAVPVSDPYRHPLPADLVRTLSTRGKVVPMNQLEKAITASSIIHPEYQKLSTIRRWKLKRPASRIPYDVPYARLEVRSAETPLGHLAVILNNSDESASAPLPWASGRYRATDLLTGETLSSDAARRNHEFAPYAVRLFRLTPGY